MNSEQERHARYLERYSEKWSTIEQYAQTNLVLPRYDDSGENGLLIERQRVSSDLLFQEILKLNYVCSNFNQSNEEGDDHTGKHPEDLQLIPSNYRRMYQNPLTK